MRLAIDDRTILFNESDDAAAAPHTLSSVLPLVKDLIHCLTACSLEPAHTLSSEVTVEEMVDPLAGSSHAKTMTNAATVTTAIVSPAPLLPLPPTPEVAAPDSHIVHPLTPIAGAESGTAPCSPVPVAAGVAPVQGMVRLGHHDPDRGDSHHDEVTVHCAVRAAARQGVSSVPLGLPVSKRKREEDHDERRSWHPVAEAPQRLPQSVRTTVTPRAGVRQRDGSDDDGEDSPPPQQQTGNHMRTKSINCSGRSVERTYSNSNSNSSRARSGRMNIVKANSSTMRGAETGMSLNMGMTTNTALPSGSLTGMNQMSASPASGSIPPVPGAADSAQPGPGATVTETATPRTLHVPVATSAAPTVSGATQSATCTAAGVDPVLSHSASLPMTPMQMQMQMPMQMPMSISAASMMMPMSYFLSGQQPVSAFQQQQQQQLLYLQQQQLLQRVQYADQLHLLELRNAMKERRIADLREDVRDREMLAQVQADQLRRTRLLAGVTDALH